MSIIARYHNVHRDFEEGLLDAEFNALFKYSSKDGRLLPFQINISIAGGEVDGFFNIKRQSLFSFETLIFSSLSEKLEYQFL